MSNILITGITGFIGSHLAQCLSNNKNNNIYGMYRSVKHESVFNALSLNNKKNINLLLGDISNYSNFENILTQYDINEVYHLASQAIVRNASRAPLSTYKTNIFGTINLLEAVRNISIQYDKKINTYVMSSDKAYGEHNKLPYIENMTFNVDDIYSSSKSCEDMIARSYSFNYNLPIVVGRPANTYGLDFNWSRLVPSLAKSCLLPNENDKPLILNEGSYNFVREYNYVEDTISAIELLIKNIDKTKGKAYNISSGNIHTTKKIVETFLELTNNVDKKIIFNKKEVTFKEIPKQYLDSSKIITDTRWKSEYSLEGGLKRTIEKYKKWFEDS